MRLAVLVSGTGTILEAMIARPLPIAVVIADRPCRALEVARAAPVPSELVDRYDHGGFSQSFDREGYTEALTRALLERRIDLVAMAGFGTITTAHFADAFPGRVLNTHPSLLPQFPGWRAVKEALASAVPMTGCTVHLMTAEVDAGAILAQESVEVRPDDSEATLHERIKVVERRLYPTVIEGVLEGLRQGREPAEYGH